MDDKLQGLLPLYRIKGAVLHSQSLSTKHSMNPWVQPQPRSASTHIIRNSRYYTSFLRTIGHGDPAGPRRVDVRVDEMKRRGKLPVGCCPELVCPKRNAAHVDRCRVVEDPLNGGDCLREEVLLREQGDGLMAQRAPPIHRGDRRSCSYEERGGLHGVATIGVGERWNRRARKQSHTGLARSASQGAGDERGMIEPSF